MACLSGLKASTLHGLRISTWIKWGIDGNSFAKVRPPWIATWPLLVDICPLEAGSTTPLSLWRDELKNEKPHETGNMKNSMKYSLFVSFFPFMVLDPRVLETTKPGFLNPTEPSGESIYRLNLDDAPMPVPQKDEIGWLELKENHKKPCLFGPQNMDSNTLRL